MHSYYELNISRQSGGGTSNAAKARASNGGDRWKDGGGGRDRTADPRLMSPLLYQLSYTATLMA